MNRTVRLGTGDRRSCLSHERFLRARVSALRGPLRHPDALLAIANARSVLGENTWARAVMRALAALPDGFGDTRVQATNWLVADAASRGDWATVEALAPPADALFARSKALRGAAGVRRGLPGSKQAASPPGGWWTQPVSLHRFVSGPNLTPLERPPQTGEVLPDALRLFAWVLRQAPARLTVVDFRLLAVAWGRVASGTEVAAGMGRRIATLDARLDPTEAQRRLLAAARDDLVPLLRAVPLRLRGALPPGTVVDDALDLLTRERVTTFEAAVRALVGPIPAAGRLESWAQYGAVLEAWDAVLLVASRELAAVTISAAWHALCNFAYSISAKEEEVLFAHHLYVWLEAACRSLDAAADVALLKRNILATA